VKQASWIHTVEIQDRLAVEVLADELDKGESQTVILAREMKASWVLMDERLARRKLEALDIPRIGTLGILLKAKELGLIAAVKPHLDKLRSRGFRLTRLVYKATLARAGES
jgi:predicted nucleic acid-binding protein